MFKALFNALLSALFEGPPSRPDVTTPTRPGLSASTNIWLTKGRLVVSKSPSAGFRAFFNDLFYYLFEQPPSRPHVATSTRSGSSSSAFITVMVMKGSVYVIKSPSSCLRPFLMPFLVPFLRGHLPGLASLHLHYQGPYLPQLYGHEKPSLCV